MKKGELSIRSIRVKLRWVIVTLKIFAISLSRIVSELNDLASMKPRF
jgi:hypothetical protein